MKIMCFPELLKKRCDEDLTAKNAKIAKKKFNYETHEKNGM